ncbi:septum site-determining protein MinC [Acidihalobacter prosperus]|uniref:Probable septum site-determining protein MinC n=1 Tax=Acidihalobacter prosperus TaxID=160660 RepID=A0A1A6C261_9GAMM|nr:septum site-determining protein MinC [Acidihalobacter prosperus]OBS08643.1 septum site-determining protein MinC [Acidihalobacter prosperus]
MSQAPTRGGGAQAAPACELKGSRFTLSVLNLHSADLTAIEGRLADLLAQAPPGFLDQAPVVLDAGPLSEPETLDLEALDALLRAHALIPVALRGGDALRARAASAGLAVLPESPAPASTAAPTAEAAETPRQEPAGNGPRTITRPVRSGQQVYAEGGDLVILGAVSAGAEVIADGSIHVYGALRGRALAGARGNESARIFCQSLEAELLSIAGCYRVLDAQPSEARGRPAHAWLSGERLMIDTL